MPDRTQTAILAGVYATLSLDLFSTLTSSPQTTEINAESRAPTLMKWVKLAVVVAFAAGLAGSSIEGNPIPFVASASVALLMYGLYVHAKNTGLRDGGQGTESTSPASPAVWSFA